MTVRAAQLGDPPDPAKAPPVEARIETDPFGDAPPWPAAAVTPGISFEARYVPGAELARGGMGRVLLAQDSLLHREVATKELLNPQDGSALRRFEREALLTARLQHPGVVSVYELARRSSGAPVLVMRRVQGRPLDEAIAAAKSLEARLQLLGPPPRAGLRGVQASRPAP